MAENLRTVEKKLSTLLANDRKAWVKIYELMQQVGDEELYAGKYPSYTAWVNSLAESCKVHVSLLWSRLKAGRMYKEYEERAKEAGRTVPAINETSVSPDNFTLIEKIAGNNTEVADDLMDKVLAGELKRQDLKDAWNVVRKDKENVRVNAHDNHRGHNEDGTSEQKDINKITAADIILCLKTDYWLHAYVSLGQKDYYEGKKRYFTEFAVNTGTSQRSRRIDALVIENKSDLVRKPDSLNIHGVEIKVSKYDLLNDHKMHEYTEYCDYFWIAVPDQLVSDAESVALADWGILSVSLEENKYGHPIKRLRVVREATEKKGLFRDKTLTSALYQLL